MKSVKLILICFFLLSCQSLTSYRYPASIDETVHLVFDLDWTIISSISKEQASQIPSSIEFEGEYYRIADGASEILEELFADPRVKVSFFSGGKRHRNEAVLKKLLLVDKSSAFDHAYKILSFDDLNPIVSDPENTQGLRFTERYRKNLSLVSDRLDNIILIDDNPNFYFGNEQKRSLLWLGETFEHFENYGDVLNSRSSVHAEYIPRNFDQWWLSRNKLYLVSDVIQRALEDQSQMSFRDKVQIQAKTMGLSENQLTPDILKVLNRRKALKLADFPNCAEIMSVFLR